MMYKVNAVVVQ